MTKNLQLIIVLLIEAAWTPQPKSESITGEYLFYGNNAVLNTGSEIYGVVVDDKLHKLHAQVAPIQKDSFDMVQVYIKGLISKNPNAEGWPEVITIKDIDSVAPSTPFENQMIEIRTE